MSWDRYPTMHFTSASDSSSKLQTSKYVHQKLCISAEFMHTRNRRMNKSVPVFLFTTLTMLKSWVFWTSVSPFQWFWMFFLPIAGCLLGCVWWFSHQRAWGFADWVYKCHGHLTEWLTLCDRYWAVIIFLSLVHLHLFTLNYCIFGMMSKIFSFLPFFFL